MESFVGSGSIARSRRMAFRVERGRYSQAPGVIPLYFCPMKRIFLLSPARCSGKRGALLLNDRAAFDVARRIRTASGVPLGEVFSFVSGLYFRGKMAYARAFARPPEGVGGVLVITPNRGLLDWEHAITLDDFREFIGVDVHQDDGRYRLPVERDATRLASTLESDCEVVLLGSVATDKYSEVLAAAFPRLLFPPAFVGRGDMSRGGLMLRAAENGQELDYVPLAGATRHGPRPPKLPPIRR
jgi:hypothetical protein